MSLKACSKCKLEKPRSEFYKRYEGSTSACKSCCDIASRAWKSRNIEKSKDGMRAWRKSNALRCKLAREQWAKDNPEKVKESARWGRIKRTYGITKTQYLSLLKAQNNGCGICGSREAGGMGSFHVDHCHDTEVIRGLLCALCNKAIGMLGDTADNVQRAVTYLRKSVSPSLDLADVA